MAASLDSPSPVHLKKESTSFMVSSPLFSPSSDKLFWSSLRSRIDKLLENWHCKVTVGQDQLGLHTSPATHMNVGKSDRVKRMKEDSQLLLRGFDSIAHTLSQLSDNLDNALQGARNLAEPPTLREIFHSSLKNSETTKEGELEEQQIEEQEKRKRLKRKFDSSDISADERNDSHKEHEQNSNDKKLKKAKNVAVSMATKAAALARELRFIKSDLCFTQERCAQLEEENKRLRDGFCQGIKPEEDDLMRLQMEALLAEKSRLANENANMIRENQCLHQLVEYHQLTSQDLSESYEHIRGMCVDFSSPPSITEEAEDNVDDDDDIAVARTPQTKTFSFSISLDECFHQEQND